MTNAIERDGERVLTLKKLAQAVAAHFVAVKGENANLTQIRDERVGLLFATIKNTAPTMTDGEQVAVAYAFGLSLSAAGFALTTVASRRSEMLFILAHSNLIEDGANKWRKTIDQARRCLKSARENLLADIEAAKAARDAAEERYKNLLSEFAGLDAAEAEGLIE